MRTLFSSKRNAAETAMRNGTPVRIGAVALYRKLRDDDIMLTDSPKMDLGYLAEPIPLHWHTAARDIKIGQLWYLATQATHLWANGVITGGTQTDTIINALTRGVDMWVRPNLSFTKPPDDGKVNAWKITGVTLSRDQRYGLWNLASDTPVEVWPHPCLASALQ